MTIDQQRGGTGERDAGWDALLDRFDRHTEIAHSMGGQARIDRQHGKGALTAIERVVELLDPGTFREIGTFTGLAVESPRDALVAGHGLIDGRPVLVGAEDATVQGGSIGSAGSSKRARLAALALQEHVPLVMLLDGAGHRVSSAMERHRPAPGDLALMADLIGHVPTIAVVHGASAGHGALTAPLCDTIIMVEGQGQLFVAGPPLVAAATGEQIDKETLGGSEVHLASGVGDLGAADDHAALALVRRLLSMDELTEPADPSETRSLTELIPANQRAPYDMRHVLAALFDADSVLVMQERYGASLITAFGRLAGVTVAIVANQPLVRGGALDADAARKAERFIGLAGSRGLPLIQLADNPGVLPGAAAERAGALRAAANMFVAQHRHPHPKLHVTMRKAYGFGSSMMGQNPYGHQTVTLALPDATVGAMPAKGGADAIAADDATREKLVELEAGGPWRQADTLSYDEVVHPDDLRQVLIDSLRLASGRLGPPRQPR
ncbi:MAG: acetyl-CoA carboxylase carboxyltransferase subunit [Acidimicrobiales bacterium]|nr:acetyl-CoA carboxylase carboxyltransferase subunit [Acidimicrobiales bacterium]